MMDALYLLSLFEERYTSTHVPQQHKVLLVLSL